jgi:hypothetical protein
MKYWLTPARNHPKGKARMTSEQSSGIQSSCFNRTICFFLAVNLFNLITIIALMIMMMMMMMMALKNTVLNHVTVLIQIAVLKQTNSLNIFNESVTMHPVLQPKLENDNAHINVFIMVFVLATQVDK